MDEKDNTGTIKKIDTRAEVTILFTMIRLLGDDGVSRNIPVTTRDINEILKEMPTFAVEFSKSFCFDFHDIIKVAVEVEGKLMPLDGLFGANNSPRHYMPGKGRVYHLKDIKDGDSDEMNFLKSVMEENNETSCFLSDTKKISFFNPENGDRVLDYSDITAIDLRATIKAPEEKKVEPEENPKPDGPDKPTIN